MINRIQETIRFFILGLRLGATLSDRVRLAFFLTFGRVFSRGTRVYKTFRVHVFGHTFPIELSNDFGDAFVLSEIFSDEEYAVSDQDPKVIFDLGANIGLTTLYLKARYPNAVIHAFEPDPESFARLQRNIASLSDVYAYETAICGSAGTRTFYRSPVFHMRNSLISRAAHDQEIHMQCITLADALEMAGVDTVDVCKFDIEGAEFEIFPDFAHFNRIKTLVGEVHPYLNSRYDERTFLEVFEKHYSSVVLSHLKDKTFLQCSSPAV